MDSARSISACLVFEYISRTYTYRYQSKSIRSYSHDWSWLLFIAAENKKSTLSRVFEYYTQSIYEKVFFFFYWSIHCHMHSAAVWQLCTRQQHSSLALWVETLGVCVCDLINTHLKPFNLFGIVFITHFNNISFDFSSRLLAYVYKWNRLSLLYNEIISVTHVRKKEKHKTKP